MNFITAATISARYGALWDALLLNQISFGTFATQLGDLRRAMRSLGA